MASDETPQPEVNDPVGQQLKRAREKLGLSVAQVADAQHLRPAVIQAIESGDHSRIDSELFLKGYVRAYANQVGLDPDALIESLDRELEPLRKERERQYEANPLVDIERRRRQKRRIAKGLLLVLVLVLAGYLVFHFVIEDQVSETAASSQAESAVPAQADTAESAQEQPAIEEEPAGVSNESELAAPADTGTLDNVDTSESGDLTAPVAPDGTAVAAPTGQEAVAVAGAETNAEAPSTATEPEPIALSDKGRLQMTFKADCWIQVSDSVGNRLVASLQRSGDTIDVAGEAPLRVVIGAVDAVDTINFEGEPVDLNDFRVTNNRTEFTLAP
ncbi:hypothetical protein MSNKSG1_05006 [Marinobacter santoriniensis NKSG1]|uniref:HTH cro/C1-type domain-containing protein n=1 Tax=Marinobacter santoriniensis NKSG1 TaxID=1288826 RepID=M7CSS9_9GAMM|nr:RodZ domain-containing protein [Marinobacter santoriniensis]EMP56666.1 hypothetical protein MSNKSG1_05006 [Marinobacter santoriniensis NKSG1]